MTHGVYMFWLGFTSGVVIGVLVTSVAYMIAEAL